LFAFVVLGGVVVYALCMRYCRRRRSNKMLLCHRRSSTGALGRLLQLCADQHLKTSFSGRSRVLLDGDLLEGLDKLYEIIANDTEKMVVIACDQLWESALCIGELTIARLKAVPTMALQLPKYRQPSPAEVVQGAINGGSGCEDLTSHGISRAMVEDTVHNFGDLPRIHLLDTMSKAYAEKLASALTTTDSNNVMPVAFEPDHAGEHKSVCIIASMQEVEDAATAYLLLKFLARRLASLPDLMPCILLPAEDEIGSEVKLATVLFRSTSTEDAVFMHALSTLSLHTATSVPVILDTVYKFPSHKYMLESCVKVFGEDNGLPLSHFIMSIFKEIACLFHPETASMELMQVQADAIVDRLKKPRRLLKKGSRVSSPLSRSRADVSSKLEIPDEIEMVAAASEDSHVSRI